MILANAELVLPAEVFRGALWIEDGRISDITRGGAVPDGAEDLRGDLLVPGLIDLHTDHLEKHLVPRPGTVWHAMSAAMAHDAPVISAGITTVFDSLALAGLKNGIDRGTILAPMLEGLAEARRHGALRADHLVHLRCELTEPDILDRVARHGDAPEVRMLSLMDHGPGARQFPDPAVWMARQRAATGLSEAGLIALRDQRLAARASFVDTHRAEVARFAAERGLVVASHDDATAAHIEEVLALGACIAEFPTTAIAARAARAGGMRVLMGAPNLVRGGSHVGNLSAGDCARAGLLDLLASDYVPSSLAQAALLLTRDPFGWSLPAAFATVTANPAAVAGLSDRGAILPELRADLLRLARVGDVPVVRAVWCRGVRVN
jgi:alpha-D-ribose 1-methylphosphonate 5-triphosphate diphosphatase